MLLLSTLDMLPISNNHSFFPSTPIPSVHSVHLIRAIDSELNVVWCGGGPFHNHVVFWLHLVLVMWNMNVNNGAVTSFCNVAKRYTIRPNRTSLLHST